MKTESNLYCVRPSDLSGHRIQVQLRVPRPSPDGQVLAMPAWVPGSYLIRDFARQVETIQASCGGKAVPVQKLDNHSWRCDPCTGPLVVDYTVYAWDLSVRAAHVDETHAFFNGAAVFLEVCDQGHEPCLVDIQAPEGVNDWRVHTSLPEAAGLAGAAARHGFGLYRAPDYDALIDHPVEIGRPQVVTFTAHGAPHEMVFTGVVPGVDFDRIAADVRKICEAQIALFEPDTLQAPFLDSADRYVFMTMVTGDGYGGLEHRSSTALMASRRDLPLVGREQAGEGYQTFLGLVSHEYFHTWNVKRIKPAAFAPYRLSRENHTRLLWVFEGFTSYYDDLMLLRAGVIGMDDYLRMLGKTITNVARGAGRLKQSVAESSFDAWTRYYKQDENSPNALVSYYTKGSLVALGLDLLIRRESGGTRSLDDVMRLMWQRYGRDFYRSHPYGVPEDAMPALVTDATGVDVADYLRRYADGREDPPLEALLRDAYVDMQWKAASPTPSLDARLRAERGELQVATVYEGGAGHAAGLSAGDTLVAVAGLRVTDNASLERVLNACQPGDTVSVHVFRRDELRCFNLPIRPPEKTECQLRRTAPAKAS